MKPLSFLIAPGMRLPFATAAKLTAKRASPALFPDDDKGRTVVSNLSNEIIWAYWKGVD